MTNELPFHIEGDKSKPALLLLHDLLGCNTTWQAVKPALLEHYQLVFVELWGHGAGVLPEQIGAFSGSGYIEEFEIIRHIIGVPRWSVCGLGYGGGLAMRYAFNKPAIVEKLTLVDVGIFFDPKLDDKKHLMLHELRGSVSMEGLKQHPGNFALDNEVLKQRLVRYANEVSKTSMLGAFSYYDDLSLFGSHYRFQMPVTNCCTNSQVMANRHLATLAPKLSLKTLDVTDTVPLPLSEPEWFVEQLV